MFKVRAVTLYLYCAVENGDSVIIQHILKRGADANNDPLLRSI